MSNWYVSDRDLVVKNESARRFWNPVTIWKFWEKIFEENTLNYPIHSSSWKISEKLSSLWPFWDSKTQPSSLTAILFYEHLLRFVIIKVENIWKQLKLPILIFFTTFSKSLENFKFSDPFGTREPFFKSFNKVRI